jgi:F-type H+-transporting ATPase subunit alpha
MQLNPSEISELIKNRIQNLDAGVQMRTQGTVVSVTDGICRIHGLSDVMQGEMLEFPKSTFGLALNLERDSVGSVILGEYEHITEGDAVKCTGKILSVPVGPELLGRVVNSLGQPIDGKGPINAKMTDVIEKVAASASSSSAIARPERLRSRSIRSSTRRARISSACTLRSGRKPRPSRTWCASSRSMARWPIPS